MKKSASLENTIANRSRQPRAASVRKSGVPVVTTAMKVKLSPARRQEPAGLLEEHFAGDGEVHAVSFEYFNPAAGEVLLAGSFNGWQPRSAPMTKRRGGKWSTELLLPPGQYEYRFVVDGQWQDDPMAARFVANSFGGLNCVVKVKAAATPAVTRP
jgi:1,4-alpha-glucan branching enzyme